MTKRARAKPHRPINSTSATVSTGHIQASAEMTQSSKPLVVEYKRKGHFDAKRGDLLLQFKGTEAYTKLLAEVQDMVKRIVTGKPELLLKNRGQLAALIEGVIFRQSNALVDQTLELMDLHELFDEEVERLTGDDELKQSIREVLNKLDD